MKKFLALVLMSVCALAATSSFAQITQEQQEQHCALFAYKVKLGFLIKKTNLRMTEDKLLNAFGSSTKERVNSGNITKEAGAKEYLEYSESIQMAFTFDRSNDPDKVMTRTYDMCLNARKTKPML